MSHCILMVHVCFTVDRVCNVENSLRLRNGQDQFEGRVEICTRFNARRLEWRAVCDDEWNTSEAMVVCRQLGLEYDSRPGDI